MHDSVKSTQPQFVLFLFAAATYISSSGAPAPGPALTSVHGNTATPASMGDIG